MLNFGWRLHHKRLLTSGRLAKHNIYIVHSWFLCENGLHEQDNIFFDCSFAVSVWGGGLERKRNINFRFLADWYRGAWIKEGDDLTSASAGLLKALIVYSLWLIWKAKNKTTFNRVKGSPYYVIYRTIAYKSCCKSVPEPEGNIGR